MNTERSAEEQVGLLADRYSERARAYDALWSPVIRPLGERLLDRLPLAAAHDVIDVGCGSGALLPHIQRRAPDATVVGVDRSEGMLELARQKHAGPLLLMDAQRLDLPDSSFDVAVLAYVLFHMPDPERCLAEVRRVLRPGGVVGVVTWAGEEPPPANSVWDEELTAAGAQTLQLPAVDNAASCDTPEKLRGLFDRAGLTTTEIHRETIEHQWAPADHFEWHLSSTSRVRLQSLDEASRQACVGRVRDRLAGAPAGDFIFRAGPLLAVAARN